MRGLRHYPLVLLAVVAVAFVGWIWWDARRPGAPVGDPPAGVALDANGDLVGRMEIVGPPGARQPDADGAAPTEPTRGIPKLKPGMTRAEVEKLVGAPAAECVSPATVADGRVTYRAAYEADFGPAPTVRPIGAGRSRVPPDPTAKPADRTLVTLEFDATKPGHPLIDIYYPDPLF